MGNAMRLNVHEPNVGAGLLANAVVHSIHHRLTERHRGQARSHL
ncbi:hypothetical protein C4J83_5176 [Pseudomonas sp. LBUM920]|nr:hypothetical protein C4J83_5176 [Pseudomonas sp. LBUM920]